jgi:2-keto-3-deoxy-6-phosphogluconate aldolase
MMDIDSVMGLAPVIPVLMVDDIAHARPLAEALVAGGLPGLEVTLRTPVALDVLTELAQVLPTAVVQGFAGEVIDTRGTADGAAQPFQLDRCHALKRDGEAVRQFYPRWYRPAAPAAGPGS